MEDIVFLILCLLSIININIKGFNQFFLDYMDIKNTNQIKGIFVWMILIFHYSSYYKNNIYKYRLILNYFGSKAVSLFFFYSSFGIGESIKNKGKDYIKTLPKKIIILFIKSQLIILIYLIINIILKIKITLKKYLLSIIFKSAIGNGNWFAFTILALYFYSYISFFFIKAKSHIFVGIIIVNIICIFHIYFVYYLYYPKKGHTVGNILCFIIGFYYSLLKKYFDKIIMKNDILYYGLFSFTTLVYYYYYSYKIKSILIVSITNALFSLIVVFISMKIRFNNEFLKLLNSHSYSIYLLQRAVMLFISEKKYFESNEFIRFFFEFLTIIFISILFDYLTNFKKECKILDYRNIYEQ